jgi:Protein of unknown function (DUF1553)/Protein of unknown function (DUF1549)/Planctomycete cytochrome C
MRSIACQSVAGTIVALVLYGSFAAHSAEEPASPQESRSDRGKPVDFARSVAPILQARCLGCHGLKAQEGGLRLDSRERVLKGGDGGAVVEPGRAKESRLLHVVSGTADDKLVMPPEGSRLRAEQIDVLRAWIDQGLPWPKSVVLDRTPAEVARAHWAFRPIRRPSLPRVRNVDWSRNGIDPFILARLEAEAIEPSPEADRRTLVRRVTLDLTGLPPTPVEVEAFVNDGAPDAYEQLADRLLASPHYGERWARPWLDLCHYGDTDGYLTDQLRPVAWRYRQWLIEALNADLSLEQFTIEQLAGDLLPGATERQRIATGFLRNTLSNREGGADLEEYRVEQVVDRTAMVGTSWLGLTVGCARCHDHKYDPVSQHDYYALYSYFDNADEVNIDAPLAGEAERYRAKRTEYDRKRAELIAPQAASIAELQDRWEKRMLRAVDNPGGDYIWDRQWEVLGLVWGGNLGEGQLEGCEIVRLSVERRTEDQRDRLLDYFLQHGEITDPARFKELKLAELRSKLTELAKELPAVTRAPSMREAQTPRQTYIHVRGDFRVRGDQLTAALPEWLTPVSGSTVAATSNGLPGRRAPVVPARQTRLDLARWLVAPEQPLTARVFVNRAWQEFFGRGLVGTSDNFGMQGERPSHPELLDWLADEFRRRGGSFKELHRLIVTSATYRQSSHVRPELSARDPGNQLLARQSALRLTAEQVRDGTLAVSGLLDARIGGPSVFPPQPDAVAMEGFDNNWKPSPGGDRYRRGLYTWLQRLSPFAQGVAFDAPSNARVCARRERSNTPLQALTLLNDPVFWEAAQALADRIAREAPGDHFNERLDRVFLLCLGRLPDSAERQRLADHYHERMAVLTSQREAAATVAGVLPADADPAKAAAWTELASVLLNLHEFITRD